MKTLFLQLLALLAILSCKATDAKSLEESNNEILNVEKREPVDEEVLEKRDLESQEDEKEKEAVEKREPEAQDDEKEEVEKRDPEAQEDDEKEEVEKREPEAQDDEKEEVEKREPEAQDDEKEKVEKREPDAQDDEKEEVEKREPEKEAVVEEKREDTATANSDSEASAVEDLEARRVQARFSLVDFRGRRIGVQREGLLLFRGGTVCDDGFTWNSAHAICRTMGFGSASHYRHGLLYGTFQRRKRIGLDDVICSSTHWASCRSTTRHNCNHREDIFLTCHGTGFKLLNSAGRVVTGRREGLLTYQHGTVCDDYFSSNSAHAICRVMGYSHAVSWRHGLRYGVQQSHRRITMDDVRCRASFWNYCSYRTTHNCNHHEDVFLTCQPGHSHAHGFTLVDWRGGRARRGCEGLLLWNGGTVCDDYFNWNAAHAICRAMGFRSALAYRSGLAYGAMQRRKRIRMDDVRCRSGHFSSCHYRTRHNCSHSEDILLTCHA